MEMLGSMMVRGRAMLPVMILAIGMMIGGCDEKQAQVVVERLNDRIVVTADSIEEAEPVFKALEKALDNSLPIEVVLRGESAADKVQAGANIGAGIAGTVAQFVPGAGPVVTLLLGIGTLAGAIGGFFKRRRLVSAEGKLAETEKAIDVVMGSVNGISGVGPAITAAARSTGVSDLIEKRYAALPIPRKAPAS